MAKHTKPAAKPFRLPARWQLSQAICIRRIKPDVVIAEMTRGTNWRVGLLDLRKPKTGLDIRRKIVRLLNKSVGETCIPRRWAGNWNSLNSAGTWIFDLEPKLYVAIVVVLPAKEDRNEVDMFNVQRSLMHIATGVKERSKQYYRGARFLSVWISNEPAEAMCVLPAAGSTATILIEPRP